MSHRKILFINYKRKGVFGTMEQEVKNTYTLDEIYYEVWKDENINIVESIMNEECENKEEQVRHAYEKRDKKSEYRNKLNAMFNVLFGHEYDEVLISGEGKKKYEICIDCKNFIVFLLENSKWKNKLKDNKLNYDAYNRIFTNNLLYYASKYLEERKTQKGKAKISTDELGRILTEKFHINDNSLKLINALQDFYDTISMYIYDCEEDDALDKIRENVSKTFDEVTAKGFDGLIEYITSARDEELELIKKLRNVHKKIKSVVSSQSLQDMLSLNGDAFVKKLLEEVEDIDREADEIIKGAEAKAIDDLTAYLVDENLEIAFDQLENVITFDDIENKVSSV